VDIVPDRGASFEFSYEKNGRKSLPGRYSGRLTFLVRPQGRLLAINSLGVEDYLPGVLTRELYPDFHTEAYRAQAIVARTYALYQMARKADRDYDVEATEASQVYGGLAEGRGARRAIEAVHYTRGLVATWSSPVGERIFCTYYSSACGGRTQNVADYRPEPAIAPLRGGVRCNYCRIAKGEVYRWGPVQLDKQELTVRMANSYPELAEWGAISRVEVISHAKCGRLGRIRLVGTGGQTMELRAEDFRYAVGSRIMRSTACRLVDQGRYIELSDGCGFGHGVGLCQWGMQGQALAGRQAAQILKFYYPGMNLTRAY